MGTYTVQGAIFELVKKCDELTNAVNVHTDQLRVNQKQIAELQREVAVLKGK